MSRAPRTAALAHDTAHLEFEDQADKFCGLSRTLEHELAAEKARGDRLEKAIDEVLPKLKAARILLGDSNG